MVIKRESAEPMNQRRGVSHIVSFDIVERKCRQRSLSHVTVHEIITNAKACEMCLADRVNAPQVLDDCEMRRLQTFVVHANPDEAATTDQNLVGVNQFSRIQRGSMDVDRYSFA